MSVYVDKSFEMAASEPQAFRTGAKHGHRWCHMWADTEDELHTMAKRIGMRREWFQDNGRSLPHYDLVPTRRTAAIKIGAIETDIKPFVQAWMEKRKSENV
jgi:hypothetical protein